MPFRSIKQKEQLLQKFQKKFESFERQYLQQQSGPQDDKKADDNHNETGDDDDNHDGLEQQDSMR